MPLRKRPPAAPPQADLFTSPDYPANAPFPHPHPAFKGRCKVPIFSGEFFTVNLDTGECDCAKGAAWEWHHKHQKWVPHFYCSHKIKALADLVARHKERGEDLTWPYVKALATRYNRFEVVSAFHKELRRGNLANAWYWGNVLIAFRGMAGVVNYLLNIVYEETRDHDLAEWLLGLVQNPDAVTYQSTANAISWFCAAIKKWHLNGRLGIFEDEMRGYAALVTEYGKEVAKGGDIIATDQLPILMRKLHRGVQRSDRALLQTGLKGIQKIKPPTGEKLFKLRHRTVQELSALAPERADTPDGKRFLVYLAKRGDAIGYHDLNAYADFIAGEPYDIGRLTPMRSSGFRKFRRLPELQMGKCLQIPKYAHDNHTFFGKGFIRRFPGELRPGAVQTHLDLRWCGAYFGVAWRYLAGDQFDSCDVAWGDVKWPKWLHAAVSDLWY